MRPVNKNVFERAIMWSGTTDLIDLISFANASERYAINPVTGEVTYAAAGVPMIVTINGVRYLQAESARTCLNTYNTNLTNAAWQKITVADVRAASATPDPMGGSTTYKLIPSTDNAEHFIYQNLTGRTIGCFFKNNGHNYAYVRGFLPGPKFPSAIVNLTTGAVTGLIEPTLIKSMRAIMRSDGWIWISGVWTADSTYSEYGVTNTDSTITFAGDGIKSVDMWLPQYTAHIVSLGSPIKTPTVAVTRAKDEALIASALVSIQRDRWQWSGYLGYASTQLNAGDKRYLFHFADSGANVCGVYVSGTDLKVHVDNSNGADAILSAALTWTAATKWTVTGIRATGALTVAGPTGGSTETGSAWNRPDGALYLNMDSSLANQLDGMGRIDPV